VHELIAARAWRPKPAVTDAVGSDGDGGDDDSNSDTGAGAGHGTQTTDEVPTGIAAGALTVSGSAPLDVEVPPGGLLIVAGATHAEALLAAITARLAPTGGRLTVLGHALPFEAGRVQRDSVLVSTVGPEDSVLTVSDYVIMQVRLTARLGQRRSQLRATADCLRHFESLPHVGVPGERIETATPLSQLSTVARWCIDVALAVASARSLIAIDMGGLEPSIVWPLIAEVSRLAMPGVTLVFATDAEPSSSDSAGSESSSGLIDRALVRVTVGAAIGAAELEASVGESAELGALV
jgi:hypothetical protein